MISAILSQMPLIQHTDGNRIAMSSSHHKQSQILSNGGELPLLKTNVNIDSKFFRKRALHNGVIHYDDNLVIVEYNNGEIDVIENSPLFKMLVPNGSKVEKGQLFMIHIIYTSQGLKYGVHLNAMFSELNKTFDDSILVSESAAEKLSSTDVDYDEIIIYRKVFDINYDAFDKGYLRKGDWIYREYTKPIQLLSSPIREEVSKYDYEILDVKIQLFDTPKKLKLKCSNKVLNYIDKHSIDAEYEKISKIVDSKNVKRVKKEILTDNEGIGLIRIKRYRKKIPLQKGDKLVNRYGNKGTVSDIVDDKYLIKKFRSKLPNINFVPEIVFNALGIHTRMNPSQLGELSLLYILRYTIPNIIRSMKTKKFSDIEILMFIVKNVHEKLSEKYANSIKQSILKLSTKRQSEILQDILNRGLQLELPVFGDNYMLKIYDIVKTLAPNYFENLLTLGYGSFYVLKLEHMVEKKINAVSTSRYSSKGQPINGQRVGEMETWGLIAYDAPVSLYSFQKTKSDEHHSKQVAYNVASINELPDIEPTSKKLIDYLMKVVDIEINTEPEKEKGENDESNRTKNIENSNI